jgi:hypothetical protein
VIGSQKIKSFIDICLALWNQGKIGMLVQSVIDAYDANGPGGRGPNQDSESKARTYQSQVDKGQLSQAVRNLTNRHKGGLLRPGDRDEKSGQFVISVLQQKHPNARVPDDGDFDEYEDVQIASDPFPLLFFEEDVEASAARLSGGPGPGGLDGNSLKNWLLRRGTRSARLRETMAQFAEILANGSPEYALYRAATITRLVALNKEPGVRPVGIGDIFMRLWSGCVHAATKPEATNQCAEVQLCCGLRSGIEANLHAVRHVFPQSNGWQDDNDDEGVAPDVMRDEARRHNQPRMNPDLAPNFGNDPGAAPDQAHSRYQPNTGYGCALFDARNGFNELNRYQMLWTVGHLWPKARRFAYNIHRHDIICIVRTEPGKDMEILYSREGITQGGVMGMSLYGIATLPLARSMRQAIPDALQPWFADDSSAVGTAKQSAQCLLHLQQEGPRYGYFPEATKCIYVCKAEDKPIAQKAFESRGLTIQYSRGERYLGGYVGSGPKREEWV